MSRECRGAATPEDPHGPESEQSSHRPPPSEDVGVPAPRLEEVEHPPDLPRENASTHQKPRHVTPEEVASIETAIAGLQLGLRSDPSLNTGPPVPSVNDRDDNEREPEMCDKDSHRFYFSMMSHHGRQVANPCLVMVAFRQAFQLTPSHLTQENSRRLEHA